MAQKKQIPMAICYDFDGTLAPGYMQEYDFIPAIGTAPTAFWAESHALAERNDADTILAYMRLMLTKAREAGVSVTREAFRAFGATIDFFPGVEDWFGRIDAYARAKGVKVEHFIISSGLREMIEGTKIAGEFRRIYASGFMYDENDVAVWPALAINYTTKTQFLFRINKGSLEVYDNTVINTFVPKNERPLPFKNMIYVGDGETDIPCFRLVKDEGGYSIAVYGPRKPGSKALAVKILNEGRASLVAPADYREGSVVDSSVKAIIDRIEATSRIGEPR
jgi:phosphoserine phosphatase